MNQQPNNRSRFVSQAQLDVLQTILCAQLDEVLARLGVTLHRSKKMFWGRCPIHGGDNYSALNLYSEGDRLPGYWRCYTRNCHQIFRPTILGFIRGVLTQQKHNALQPQVSFAAVIKWCEELIGQKAHELKVDESDLEKRKFTSFVKCANKGLPQQDGIPREQVKKN